jgi:hypothetical protein
LPNPAPSETRARWVVVVPLEDAALFDYLTRSFAAVSDVRVVLERRRARPADSPEGPAQDRRARAPVVTNFGCSVIRRPAAVVTAAAVVPDTPASNGRTLLWPHLRITDVLSWNEETVRRG